MTTVEFDIDREIEEIEHEIHQHPQLTDKQIEDIRAMYEHIRGACESDDYEKARRTKALCVGIISEGPPAPE